MLNSDFDPLALLQHLHTQDIAHAENMVRVSEFMLSVSQQVETQTRQLDNLFTMLQSQNRLVRHLNERVIALETANKSDINNNSL